MKKKIINISTLEVFESIHETARFYGVSPCAIYNSIYIGYKIKGDKLELFEEWLKWDPQKKEQYTRKNNIYFFN